MSKTQEAVVVFDSVSWREPIEGTIPQQWAHLSAWKGDTVQLPPTEFERLAGLGAVAPPGEAAEAIAEVETLSGPVDAGTVGDDELAGWNAADLIAYVTQNPGEAERVNRLERERKRGPRTTVLTATGFDENGDPAEPTD